MVDTGWVATIDVGAGDDIVHMKDDDAADSDKNGWQGMTDPNHGDADRYRNDTLLDGDRWLRLVGFLTVNWGALLAKTYTINSGNAQNFETYLLGNRQQRHTNR